VDRPLQVVAGCRLDREPAEQGEAERHDYSARSIIGVGALAQAVPLPVVVAAQGRGARSLDLADLLQRFRQRLAILGVAREDAGIERFAQAYGVAGQQERAAAIE